MKNHVKSAARIYVGPSAIIIMDNETKKTIRTLGYLSTTGMAMAISIALGALIGHYLDNKFKTDPWLFLVFLLFGIIAAFENLLIMVRKSRIDDRKSE
jgi:ATP synthase protein I